MDENKVNKKVLSLAVEVAQQIHSTGVETWMKKWNHKKNYSLYSKKPTFKHSGWLKITNLKGR